MSENANEQKDAPKGIVINRKTLNWVGGVLLTIVGIWKSVDFLYDKLYGEKLEFVTRYASTSEAHVVNDGIVKRGGEITIFYDQIMKNPPTDGYWFHAYIGDENGNIIANSEGRRNPDGVWNKRFYANNWNDYSTVRFQGSGFRVPERLEPDDYTVVCILEIMTPFGPIEGYLNPIPFTLVDDE